MNLNRAIHLRGSAWGNALGNYKHTKPIPPKSPGIHHKTPNIKTPDTIAPKSEIRNPPSDITQPDEDWDLIIRPKAALLELNLKEVWRYRDLLWLFVKRDFTAQYKQTILGPLWHIIQPLLTTAMFLFIFGRIARIPTDGVPAVLFYMSGITIWNYFSACFNGTSGTFAANAGIFGKVYFPRLVTPLSVIVSNMVKLGIQLLLLFAIMAWYYFVKGYPLQITASVLLLPVLLLMVAMLGLGAGIITSSLTTKYRDFGVLIGFGLQLLMYATPVVYPMSYLANSRYKIFIEANPLTAIVETFKYALFHTGTLNWNGLLYSAVFTTAVLFAGLVIFSKVEKTFMDTV